VPLKNPNFAQTFLGKLPEMRRRPIKEDGIDRVHLEEIILPLDKSIEGRASSFWDVQKNDSLSAGSSLDHPSRYFPSDIESKALFAITSASVVQQGILIPIKCPDNLDQVAAKLCKTRLAC